jgi:hypothetical protein
MLMCIYMLEYAGGTPERVPEGYCDSKQFLLVDVTLLCVCVCACILVIMILRLDSDSV